MANEASIILNPTSTPEAVSTGYQRQNTNIVAARVGMDESVVAESTGSAVIRVSGPIDVNGVLYSIVSEEILTPATDGRWYIYLDEDGGEPTALTPKLTDNPGTFSAVKNARYTSENFRILNWIIYKRSSTLYTIRHFTPEFEENLFWGSLIGGASYMYAIGNLEIYSFLADSAKRSPTFLILRPIIVYLAVGVSVTDAAFLHPGAYIFHSIDSGGSRYSYLEHLSDPVNNLSTERVSSIYANVELYFTQTTTVPYTVKLFCNHAEGIAELNINDIISIV